MTPRSPAPSFPPLALRAQGEARILPQAPPYLTIPVSRPATGKRDEKKARILVPGLLSCRWYRARGPISALALQSWIPARNLAICFFSSML